jgi:hypothetical protein
MATYRHAHQLPAPHATTTRQGLKNARKISDSPDPHGRRGRRFTQAHYRQSIGPDPELAPLWKDVLLFHWKEEAQHVVIDELEWRRENATLTAFERDTAVTDLLELIGVLDGLVRAQAQADVGYVLRCCARAMPRRDLEQLDAVMLRAYRWQYITSGIQDERLGGNLADAQMAARRGPTPVDRLTRAESAYLTAATVKGSGSWRSLRSMSPIATLKRLSSAPASARPVGILTDIGLTWWSLTITS